jgi:hypothetical protein
MGIEQNVLPKSTKRATAGTRINAPFAPAEAPLPPAKEGGEGTTDGPVILDMHPATAYIEALGSSLGRAIDS